MTATTRSRLGEDDTMARFCWNPEDALPDMLGSCLWIWDDPGKYLNPFRNQAKGAKGRMKYGLHDVLG